MKKIVFPFSLFLLLSSCTMLPSTVSLGTSTSTTASESSPASSLQPSSSASALSSSVPKKESPWEKEWQDRFDEALLGHWLPYMDLSGASVSLNVDSSVTKVGALPYASAQMVFSDVTASFMDSVSKKLHEDSVWSLSFTTDGTYIAPEILVLPYDDGFGTLACLEVEEVEAGMKGTLSLFTGRLTFGFDSSVIEEGLRNIGYDAPECPAIDVGKDPVFYGTLPGVTQGMDILALFPGQRDEDVEKAFADFSSGDYVSMPCQDWYGFLSEYVATVPMAISYTAPFEEALDEEAFAHAKEKEGFPSDFDVPDIPGALGFAMGWSTNPNEIPVYALFDPNLYVYTILEAVTKQGWSLLDLQNGTQFALIKDDVYALVQAFFGEEPRAQILFRLATPLDWETDPVAEQIRSFNERGNPAFPLADLYQGQVVYAQIFLTKRYMFLLKDKEAWKKDIVAAFQEIGYAGEDFPLTYESDEYKRTIQILQESEHGVDIYVSDVEKSE